MVRDFLRNNHSHSFSLEKLSEAMRSSGKRTSFQHSSFNEINSLTRRDQALIDQSYFPQSCLREDLGYGFRHLTSHVFSDVSPRTETKCGKSKYCQLRDVDQGGRIQITTDGAIKRNYWLTLVAIMLAAVFFCVLVAFPKSAFADFTVYVGYTGGPYYKKTVYSDADMRAMSSGTLYEYSSIDRKPSIRKGFGRGVVLSQFFTNSGINTGELKRFYFSTVDGYVVDDGGEGYGAWYYNQLCTGLYYYPNLFEASSIEDGELILDESVFDGARIVPTIIAYESDFHRVLSEQEWETPNLSSYGYRLMFGQSEPTVGNAHASASGVQAMTCIFNGTPEISFGDKTSFEGKVDDIITITPTIKAADSLIEQNAVKDLKWEISDTNVAEFVKDANGNLVTDEKGNIQIRIKAEGEVTLTATYGNSPFYKYQAKASLGGSGKGSGSGNGDGSGDGSGGNGGGNSGDSSRGDDGDGDNSITVGGDQNEAVQTSTSSSAKDQSNAEDASEGGSETASLSIKTLPQAWVVNDAENQQTSMIDDPLLIARPASVAVMLFGCFVFGVILRVIECERSKDPYVEARLASELKASKQNPKDS